MGWHARPAPFVPQFIPLDGGGELTLVSVQSRRVPVNPFEPEWKQWIGRLPFGWARRLHLPLPTVPDPGLGRTNTFLTCWLIVPNAAAAMGPGPRLAIWMEDAAGRMTYMDRAAPALKGMLPDGRRWEMRRFDVVPRRSEWLRIGVDDGRYNDPRRLGEFRVRNPLFDPLTPPLNPIPLPQTVREDDLAFTLDRAVIETHVGSTRLDFTVRESGRLSGNWVGHRVTQASDATGNLSEGEYWDWNPDATAGRSHITSAQIPLPAGEPWRMQVEFRQRAGFASDEIWRLHGVPDSISTGGDQARQTRLHGVRVGVKQVSLNRQPEVGSDPGNHDPVRGVLKLEADRAPDSNPWHLTILRAVDDRGHEVKLRDWGESGLAREILFELSPGAESMDLDIAFAPGRLVWFTVLAVTNDE